MKIARPDQWKQERVKNTTAIFHDSWFRQATAVYIDQTYASIIISNFQDLNVFDDN